MNTVLTWLPEMLMALELGDEDEEEDSDFVQVARPYLHTKEYHVVRGGSMLAVAQELCEGFGVLVGRLTDGERAAQGGGLQRRGKFGVKFHEDLSDLFVFVDLQGGDGGAREVGFVC